MQLIHINGFIPDQKNTPRVGHLEYESITLFCQTHNSTTGENLLINCGIIT